MSTKRWSRIVPVAGMLSVVGLTDDLGAAAPAFDATAIEAYVKQQMEEEHYPSLSVGIVADGQLVFARAYGVADRESGQKATIDHLYLIGSITKVFTATVMCQLRDNGLLRLDDPITKYLPDTVKVPSDPRGAAQITLRHLATHSSGLHRLPPNLTPKGDDFYGGYTLSQMYEGLSQETFAYPTGEKYLYSNFAVGLLGHLLERATGQTYEALLKRRLFDPLGMEHTFIEVPPSARAMVTTGYRGKELAEPAMVWDLGMLNPGGGLVSSVPDLAKFLALQMRAGQTGVTPVAGGTLAELHRPQRLTNSWKGGVGLGWHITPSSELGDVVWHNGGVAGHFSFMGFIPQRKLGVIVLTNGGKSVDAPAWKLLALAHDTMQATTAPAGPLPTGNEILDRSVAAMGGAEKLATVHNRRFRGNADMGGVDLTFESYQAEPARFHMKMTMGPMVMGEQGSDGKIVWEKAMGEKPKIITGNMREMFLREAHLHRDTEWRTLYSEARCEGIVEFAGHRCYKVAMTPKAGAEETRYYRVDDGLPAGMETTLETPLFGEATIQEVYEEFTSFDNILYPRKTTQKIGDTEILTMTLERVEHNVEIPEDRFALPAEVKRLAETQPAATTSPAG